MLLAAWRTHLSGGPDILLVTYSLVALQTMCCSELGCWHAGLTTHPTASPSTAASAATTFTASASPAAAAASSPGASGAQPEWEHTGQDSIPTALPADAAGKWLPGTMLDDGLHGLLRMAQPDARHKPLLHLLSKVDLGNSHPPTAAPLQGSSQSKGPQGQPEAVLNSWLMGLGVLVIQPFAQCLWRPCKILSRDLNAGHASSQDMCFVPEHCFGRRQMPRWSSQAWAAGRQACPCCPTPRSPRCPRHPRGMAAACSRLQACPSASPRRPSQAPPPGATSSAQSSSRQHHVSSTWCGRCRWQPGEGRQESWAGKGFHQAACA